MTTPIDPITTSVMLFNYAVEQGKIKKDQLPIMPKAYQTRNRRDFFREDEIPFLVEGLLTYAKDEKQKDGKNASHPVKFYRRANCYIALCVLFTGIRVKELSHMKWQDYGVLDGIPYFDISGAIAKTKNHPRRNWGDPELVKHLHDWLKNPINENNKNEDYIFSRVGTGKYKNINNDWFKAFLKKFKGEDEKPLLKYRGTGNDRSLYSLRHTFLTRSILADMSLYRLTDLAGTSEKMLKNHYVELIDSENSPIDKDTFVKVGEIKNQSGIHD